MAGKKREHAPHTQIERGPSIREIDKLQAIRHLLHASIRMLFADEDPFALHLVCQSCDKLISDCIKVDNFNTSSFMDSIVIPEYRREFYRIYREVYNYLKHAKTDRHIKLGVRRIVQINEISILMNIRNFNTIMPFNTAHTRYYLGYAMIMFKNLFDAEGINALMKYAKFDDQVADSFTREEMLLMMRRVSAIDNAYLAEKKEDLVDIEAVAGATRNDYVNLPPGSTAAAAI